jgi:hypothetical protein
VCSRRGIAGRYRRLRRCGLGLRRRLGGWFLGEVGECGGEGACLPEKVVGRSAIVR